MDENTKETMLENEELVTYSIELPKKLVEEFKEKCIEAGKKESDIINLSMQTFVSVREGIFNSESRK